MNLNYAIFRSESICTINDLAQIGSHNKREKKAYQSNPDIKLELTKNNIELLLLTEKYVKVFYKLTKDYYIYKLNLIFIKKVIILKVELV